MRSGLLDSSLAPQVKLRGVSLKAALKVLYCLVGNAESKSASQSGGLAGSF